VRGAEAKVPIRASETVLEDSSLLECHEIVARLDRLYLPNACIKRIFVGLIGRTVGSTLLTDPLPVVMENCVKLVDGFCGYIVPKEA